MWSTFTGDPWDEANEPEQLVQPQDSLQHRDEPAMLENPFGSSRPGVPSPATPQTINDNDLFDEVVLLHIDEASGEPMLSNTSGSSQAAESTHACDFPPAADPNLAPGVSQSQAVELELAPADAAGSAGHAAADVVEHGTTSVPVPLAPDAGVVAKSPMSKFLTLFARVGNDRC